METEETQADAILQMIKEQPRSVIRSLTQFLPADCKIRFWNHYFRLLLWVGQMKLKFKAVNFL